MLYNPGQVINPAGSVSSAPQIVQPMKVPTQASAMPQLTSSQAQALVKALKKMGTPTIDPQGATGAGTAMSDAGSAQGPPPGYDPLAALNA